MKKKKILLLGILTLLLGTFSFSNTNDNNKEKKLERVNITKLTDKNLNTKINLEQSKKILLNKYKDYSIDKLEIIAIESNIKYIFGISKNKDFKRVEIDANSGETKELERKYNRRENKNQDHKLDRNGGRKENERRTRK